MVPPHPHVYIWADTWIALGQGERGRAIGKKGRKGTEVGRKKLDGSTEGNEVGGDRRKELKVGWKEAGKSIEFCFYSFFCLREFTLNSCSTTKSAVVH